MVAIALVLPIYLKHRYCCVITKLLGVALIEY